MMLGIPQNHAIRGKLHLSQNLHCKYCSWCLPSHFTVDKENGGFQKWVCGSWAKIIKLRDKTNTVFSFYSCSTIWSGRNADCIMYYETEYSLNSSNGRILARTTVSTQLPWWSRTSCQDEIDGRKNTYIFLYRPLLHSQIQIKITWECNMKLAVYSILAKKSV